MQFIFLPPWLTILVCFIVWPILQITIALVFNHLSDSKILNFSNCLRTRTWEDDGKFYKRFFRISYWQKLLPDGAAVLESGFRKKSLQQISVPYLDKFIVETYRAELIHIFAILPFWVFGFWSPPIVILYMLFYALAVNFPCILLQRYNRPRLIRLRDRLIEKENHDS